MQVYKTRAKQIPGSHFHIVHKRAFGLHSEIKKKSKRRTYIRSAYFKKDKIFLDLFWHHLFDKQNWRDRVRRMKLYDCATELIQNSHFKPNSTIDPNKSTEVLHRFYGVTANNELFCVQIKEHTKKKQKFLISVFPTEGPVER